MITLKLDKRGFTLVELLATIAILGILMGVTISAISWVLDSARENFYESLEKDIILTAEQYYADHRSLLPRSVGQSRKVSLQTLVQNNYLKKGDVVDYGKQECNLTSSYVSVVKESKEDYNYSLYLKCPSKTIGSVESYSNTLSIGFSYNSSTHVSTVTITTDSSAKVGSYQYTVYKGKAIVYHSDGIEVGNTSNYTGTINLSDFGTGQFKIVVTAFDNHGNSKAANTTVTV